jgi:hypothetical protein
MHEYFFGPSLKMNILEIETIQVITNLVQDVDLSNQDFDQLLEVVAPEEIQKLGISYNKCKTNNEAFIRRALHSLLVR